MSLTPAVHAEIVHFMAHHLRTMLPPPLDDSPEELEHRDRAAGALIGELNPATIGEAEQVAICIAASAHGLDSFRLAGVHAGDINVAYKCRAQAASMFRRADLARRQLEKLQAARQAAAKAAQADAAPTPPPQATPSVPEPADAALAEAEAFARQCPRRAIAIRRLGRVPAGIGYKPPRPAVIHALVTGRSPALLKLDRKIA